MGNQTVLVQGGAGAVKELAVQFAAASGATVVATVSSQQKAQRARNAGAHHVIDYRTTVVPTAVRALAPSGVDRIVEVDFAANIHADSEMLTSYGVIAAYSSTSKSRTALALSRPPVQGCHREGNSSIHNASGTAFQCHHRHHNGTAKGQPATHNR